MIENIEERLRDFVSYVEKNLNGYEKGEAQLFLERLFKSFGNKGVKEAGAEFEAQVKIDGKTKYIDLLWPEVVLIEMKSSKEKNLAVHFRQARNYWIGLFERQTEYVILCNFDEIWVYNWRYQSVPVSKIKLKDLPERWRSLAFLLPPEQRVSTDYIDDTVSVTKEAAGKCRSRRPAHHRPQLHGSLLPAIGSQLLHKLPSGDRARRAYLPERWQYHLRHPRCC